MKTLRTLYLWISIYSVLPLAAMVLFVLFLDATLRFLPLIICFLILIGGISRAVNLLKCAKILKSRGLSELADKEDPNEGSMDFAITGHFLWGIHSRAVVPLDCIVAVRTSGARCTNSVSKSNVTLSVITLEGQKIDILRYKGLSFDKGLQEINVCCRSLKNRIPTLQVR